MYSAPSAYGVEYCTHSPLGAMIAWPAVTSVDPSAVVTRRTPRSTPVYSSNSGVWPGSTQPLGLFILATLTSAVAEFTRPTYSSMIFGLFPAAATIDGASMCFMDRSVLRTAVSIVTIGCAMLRAMPVTEVEFSFVMPCLNEARTLPTCIKKAQSSIQRLRLSAEIVVADNGSTDSSQDVATSLGARVVPVPTRGYGAALATGLHAACGRF